MIGDTERWSRRAWRGLAPRVAFVGDPWFWAAVGVGVVFWGILGYTLPARPLAWSQVWSWPFVSLALGQPCWEELVFRGVCQGSLRHYVWGQRAWYGVSGANVVVSGLFVLAHAWTHPLGWALAVFWPSLIFGWVRDRHASVLPAMVLHALYNTGYFWLSGLPGPLPPP